MTPYLIPQVSIKENLLQGGPASTTVGGRINECAHCHWQILLLTAHSPQRLNCPNLAVNSSTVLMAGRQVKLWQRKAVGPAPRGP